MRKIFIILIALIVLIGILFYFFKKSPKIVNYPPTGKTIVAFGDSLVVGVGSTASNDFVSLLSKKIGEPIINMGVSGNTSSQGLARIDEVNAQDPKVVLLLLGGNDFLLKVPVKETFANMEKIIEALESEGAVVVLLGVRGGLLTDSYDEYFEDLAQKKGTLYVPNVLDGLLAHQEYMSDSIHPNDIGYRKIAEKIYPVLLKAIR